MRFPQPEEFLAVRPQIAEAIHRTPVLTCTALDEMSGAQLFFKCENFQKVGAFKFRGALFAASQLPEEALQKGLATHSSGNFGQAVALAAKQLGVPAYIVMPEDAPEAKRNAVSGYEAEVIFCKPGQANREQALEEVLRQTGASALHPYNQEEVIMGQGTAAQELLEDHPDLDAIIAPVGGGGLLAGTVIAAANLSPNCDIYGGEPAQADDAARSLESGSLQGCEKPLTIADGLRMNLGSEGFSIIRDRVHSIIRVEEEEIIAAMRLIWERMKLIVEPSSAVTLAAILNTPQEFKGKRVGVILSGGNVDLAKLPF